MDCIEAIGLCSQCIKYSAISIFLDFSPIVWEYLGLYTYN